MQDMSYWYWESRFASCEHFRDGCDVDAMRASVAMNRELTEDEIADLHEHMDRDRTGLDDDDIIPSAYAVTMAPKYNTAHVVVWAERGLC